MILYSQRKEIEHLFYEWCDLNGIAKLPNSLVAFMEINGWLNEEAVIKDVPFKGCTMTNAKDLPVQQENLIEEAEAEDVVPVTRCENCYAYGKDKELARA